jgi:CHAD domain-containing protein
VQPVEQSVKKAGRRIHKLDLKRPGWTAIEPGLQHSYEQVRETFRAAVQKPSPENLHAWRKQVKTFWYQLQLIFPEQAPEMRTLIDRLDRLGEQLGEEHDLGLLKQFVIEQHDERDKIEELKKLIEARQRRLRQSVLKLGDQLFAEASVSVSRRMESHWNAFHGD